MVLACKNPCIVDIHKLQRFLLNNVQQGAHFKAKTRQLFLTFWFLRHIILILFNTFALNNILL